MGEIQGPTAKIIDAAAGGTINNKTPKEAYEFIEEMSLNNYQWQLMRTKLTKKVHLVMRCDSSEGGIHTEYQSFNPSTEEEQVHYMGNNNSRPQNNPYSNTYNAGWRNHPNFSWGGQGNQRPQNPPGFQQPPYQQEKKPNLEEMLMKFISIGQLAKLISERSQGSLPSNTEANPREQLNVINVRDEEGLVEPKPEPK
ncbi:hypothetical protein CXB51_004774 [Gossypium anomalum]|uniref:Uncharacterized protein n=1 Tax=Gossypium anomalum TaxID=47600 RepID=A0A8J6DAI7_9ROSI|nr:hypothetical protein CXB51_004774 [Gossypium anomalum]